MIRDCADAQADLQLCCYTIRVPNILDPDVGPDLGPNCLQALSVDNTSRQRVEHCCVFLLK